MKKILITGATSGIGQSLALDLISKGDKVISLSRTGSVNGAEQHIHFDVTSAESLPPFEGPLQGLVYCPGSINLKPFRNLKIADYREDLEINVLGAIKVIQHYLPNLKAAAGSSIILFSSVAAQMGMPYHTSVGVSKGAVEGFARALAAELAPAIRVNVIAPSLVNTPLAARLTDTETKIAAAAERHPLKRIGTAADIARLAAWLLSEEASWISGQVLHADGGMSTLK